MQSVIYGRLIVIFSVTWVTMTLAITKYINQKIMKKKDILGAHK